MYIKKIFASMIAAFTVFGACAGLVACDDELETAQTSETEAVETQTFETEINYDGINAEKYVKSVTYKGLRVTLDDEDASKEDALWRSIYATVEINEYPEEKVKYYFEQTKKAYMHIVGDDEDDYLLLLKNRGITEEIMMEEAREMVKQDLVYRYILAKENIVLTEREKTELFDKYVDKYVIEFNKSHEYIVAKMADYVYESMLYDKTMELLIKSNEFVVEGDTETTDAQEN